MVEISYLKNLTGKKQGRFESGTKLSARQQESHQLPVKQCKRSVKPVFSWLGTPTFERMNKMVIRSIAPFAVILFSGLLAMRAISEQHDSRAGERLFSENINLALRRTAHILLAMNGNRTGTIPPVQQADENTWVIALEQNFDYDSLPDILRESFAMHHITGTYNVAMLNCQTDDLTLGYTASTADTTSEVPCTGRDQKAGCYNLSVSFPDRSTASVASSRWWWATGLLLALFVVLTGFGISKKKYSEKGKSTGDTDTGESTLHFGQSALDFANQKLFVKGKSIDLTYREAKLLLFLGRHTGQLVSRDMILQSVWGDEGILVGRSVDVFVSRLRKRLSGDETVRIANVHGIGYRLEVHEML